SQSGRDINTNNLNSHAGVSHTDGGNGYNLNGQLSRSEQGYDNAADSPTLYTGQDIQPIVKNVKDVKKVIENVIVKDEVKEDKADILLLVGDESNDNETKKRTKAHNLNDDVILKIKDEL
ncbi:8402_t:CDS:2, partial [Racocetra persica]